MKRNDLRERLAHTSTLKPFTLYRQRMPENFSCTPLHWHAEFEINFILEGCADYIVGDERFTSHSGDIIITAPNILHSAYPHGDDKQIYEVFLFSQEMLGASAGDRLSAEFILPIISGELYINPRITKKHVHYSELRISMENIISSAVDDSSMLDMLIKSELLRFFWILYASGDITKNSAKSLSSGGMIRPAIEYINAHYSDDISIRSLAKTVGLSESYFMQKFRETAGISAIEYLNQLRIKAVCEQLLSTQKSVAEIAFDCGFRNISNFNRTFRRMTGVTPREYGRYGGKRHGETAIQ